MDVAIDYQNNVGVISLKGRLDSAAAPEFDAWFSGQDSPDCRCYLIDMAEMSYITSAGLRSMLKLLKTLEARGGRLAICAMNNPVQDLFKIAGFTSFFTLYEGQGQALAELAE